MELDSLQAAAGHISLRSGGSTRSNGAGAPPLKVPNETATPDKVSAPKPSGVNFDPAKATQNLQAAIKLLNDQMSATNRGLGFSYDQSKQSAVIKVTDLKSGEVVRQIPSEEVLRVAHKLDELKGILFNKVS